MAIFGDVILSGVFLGVIIFKGVIFFPEFDDFSFAFPLLPESILFFPETFFPLLFFFIVFSFLIVVSSL